VSVHSGHVLYHRPSGQTHFLNEGGALLLRECLLEPRDAVQAARALADLQGAEPDPQFLLAPDAFFGPRVEATAKGDIVHMRAPSDSVVRESKTTRAAWIVFPRWIAGAALSLESVTADQAFFSLATNAFNYELLGEPAFETVRTIVGASRRMRLRYSSLDEAVRALDALEEPRDA